MEKDTIVIGGEISLALDTVDGETTLVTETDGSPGDFFPLLPKEYTGQMEFTPTMESQVVGVRGFYMAEDIVINPIPQNYGLVTWNGHSLRIS